MNERERNQIIKRQQTERELDFKRLMKDPAFRAFMYGIIGDGRLFDDLPNNAQTMPIAEGERRVAARHMKTINRLCPALGVTMFEEAKQREDELANGRRDNSSRNGGSDGDEDSNDGDGSGDE